MALLGRTFDAVVFDWDAVAASGGCAEAPALRSRVEALCEVAVHVFVLSDSELGDVDRGLGARPSGPGRLHLCVRGGAEVFEVTRAGPAAVPDVDPEVWLARQGITGALVLVAVGGLGPAGGPGALGRSRSVPERATVVSFGSLGEAPRDDPDGVLHLPGGVASLVEVLDEQLRRRRERRVPHVDEDPCWVIPLPDDPARERVAEALGALGNGHAGLRAAREEDGPGSGPLFVVNGLYTNDEVPRLLEGPVWTGLALAGGGWGGRLLDLRTGVLTRTDGPVRTLRFLSAARPEVVAMRAEGPIDLLDAGEPFSAPTGASLELARRGDTELARTSAPGGGGIVVAVRDRHGTAGELRTIERIGVWAAGRAHPPGWDRPARELAAVEEVGFDRLLAEHRAAWARLWADAEVSIEGAPDDELAARFAVFHLLNAAPDSGESAVGPRGLTGHGYGGHVFWDADVFVLPALAAIRPGAARAMLEYRVRRLPAARERAARLRLAGARFPWESATDGSDVTPRYGIGLRGERVPIRTGEQQEHIVADVAWAADTYAAWSGDEAFLAGPGRELLVDTARWWASRIRLDRDGRAHFYGVMGPDEYHETVDDNTYTNVMARWNLRRAAQLLVAENPADAEAAAWRDLADRLVDGWDPRVGLHEQFAGYWSLEPLLADHIARRPFTADLLLGRERVHGSQLVKQADVVMAHHLVPDEMRPGSLAADVAFYEPRTSHGSSLSPAIHAAVLARAGEPDRALEAFRLAARLDLDDLTGTTATGVHLATMGGVWQALAYGFCGLRPRADHLAIDPCLPRAWQALSLRLRFRGVAIGVRAEHHAVHLDCDEPVPVRVAGGPVVTCVPPGRTFRIDHPSDRRDEGR
jgi:trehalose/maltose hydrolase-like predicted phosphorylase